MSEKLVHPLEPGGNGSKITLARGFVMNFAAFFAPEFAGPAWSAIMDPVTVPLPDEEMPQARVSSTTAAFSRAWERLQAPSSRRRVPAG